GLPKVKCGDCTNQAFRPVDHGAVLGHLQGKHVMGVYPMLPDDTCWFLAVDFDKSSWKDDVRAFAETARRSVIAVAPQPDTITHHSSFEGDTPSADAGAQALVDVLVLERAVDGGDGRQRAYSAETLPFVERDRGGVPRAHPQGQVPQADSLGFGDGAPEQR